MYPLSQKVEYLKNCPLFEKLSLDELKVISLASDVVMCKKGDVLIREGDDSTDAYLVFDGEAEAYKELENGGEVSLAKFKKPDLFGEFAILGDVPRTANIRATEDLTLLKISRETFIQIINEFPGLSLKIMNLLVQRLLKTQSRWLENM